MRCGVKLPDYLHSTVLTGRDVVGDDLAYTIIWADRVTSTCDGCGQEIKRDTADECPVHLNTGAGQGGALEQWSQQHGCGTWNTVYWTYTEGDDEDDVRAAVATLDDQYRSMVADSVASLTASLRRDLDAALRRLAEPLADDESREEREREVATGSEIEPGVYREDGGPWQAWDYHDAAPDGYIAVYAQEGTP